MKKAAIWAFCILFSLACQRMAYEFISLFTEWPFTALVLGEMAGIITVAMIFLPRGGKDSPE